MRRLSFLLLIFVPMAANGQGKPPVIRLESTPFVLRTPAGERQLVLVQLESGGFKDAVFRLTRKDWSSPIEHRAAKIDGGKQTVLVPVPVAAADAPVHGYFESGAEKRDLGEAPMKPPRRWTVYLVQHTHTDIGYTRPQTEILPEHLRYIDHALDLCDLTDSYPDDARFRWTCETSWAVREYLKRRPQAQIDRLKRRVAEGRIEIAGMMLNMSEIADEGSLAASLQPLREIRAALGDAVRTAMQNDVNGAAWCLPDYFQGAGIRYLTMGINKTRSILPFDRPTAFWWESPSGKRVMAFRPDHYMTGNNWKIHTGQLDEAVFAGYLNRLEKTGYPFDGINVQFSGYSTDNSPPAQVESDVVRKWNEKYAWPHLRLAIARELFEKIEQQHAASLPVHRQAWPDWWTDGFGSAARETAASRETHAAMQANQGLLAMAVMAGIKMPAGVLDRIQTIQEALLFYDEHTFGAAESISDPMAENSMVQWGEKSSYAWEAVKAAGMLREEALGLLQSIVPRSDTPTIAVFNTLGWARSGLVLAFVDHEFVPRERSCRLVDVASGATLRGQRLRSRSEGSYWAFWLKDVPPLGFRTCRIVTEAPASTAAPAGASVLENRFYRIELDPATGALRSLLDKESNRELADKDAPWQIGQFIYERAVDRRDFDKPAFPSNHPFRRSTVSKVTMGKPSAGPLWQSAGWSAEAEGCASPNGLRLEIRLFQEVKRVEFHFTVRKQAIREPEAVYIAFPIRAPQGSIAYEGQGGLVVPAVNQLPGSSSDWQTIQNFAAVRNPQGQVILASPQVPLVQLGEINLGKWMPVTKVERPHIYSWVMNNYWFTNFLASQEGEFRWHYALTSQAGSENSAASRFGWESSVPLVSRIFAPGGGTPAQAKQPQLKLTAPGVLLVEARPAASGGVILHLREVDGRPAEIPAPAEAAFSSMTEVNVLGEPSGKPIKTIRLAPYEAKFIHLR